MRALLAIAITAGPVAADPPKPGDDLVDEPRQLDPTPGQIKLGGFEHWVTPRPNPTTRWPAFGGGQVHGLVITPPRHPDEMPWPTGMVIPPPDVGDPMAIAPGASGLGARWQPRSWSDRLSKGLYDGISKAVELVAPNGS